MLEERTCDTLSHVFREEVRLVHVCQIHRIYLTVELQNFPSTFNGNTQWPLRTPDPGFEWRSMNTIKALATMAVRCRLSGTPSGEYKACYPWAHESDSDETANVEWSSRSRSNRRGLEHAVAAPGTSIGHIHARPCTKVLGRLGEVRLMCSLTLPQFSTDAIHTPVLPGFTPSR